MAPAAFSMSPATQHLSALAGDRFLISIRHSVYMLPSSYKSSLFCTTANLFSRLQVFEAKPTFSSSRKIGSKVLILWLFAVSFFSVALSSDPSHLQDFCVADRISPVMVNGLACKNPAIVGAEDFFLSGLHLGANTSNAEGSKVTPVTVAQIGGLNTLGVALARIDYAPFGINPPHTHPRASEILTVLDGTLFVGFVTSNPENRLISKLLQKGDVFVFPAGLPHFQQNVGYGTAVSLSALSSQNPGVVTIADAVFGSNPFISPDVLAKAFQADKTVIATIQSKF